MKINSSKIIEIIFTAKVKAIELLKLKWSRISAAAFVVLVIGTYIVPIFFDSSSLKFKVTHKVGEILSANLLIRGDVDIRFLPTPRIIIYDAAIKNFKPVNKDEKIAKIYNFYAEKIIIKLPIFNFSDEFKIKEILFKNTILEKYYDNNSAAVRQNNLTEIISQFDGNNQLALATGSKVGGSTFEIGKFKFSKSNQSLPKLTILNGEFINYGPFGRQRDISKIDARINLKKNKITANASFVSDNITSDLESVIRFNSDIGENDSFLKVTSSALNLEIEGDFKGENKILKKGILNNDFKGKITAEIPELKSFYRTYFSNVNLLANRLKYSAKPISMNGDLVIRDGELNLENLSLISTLLDGKGRVKISQNNNIHFVDINLDLDNLDLDSIWSNKNKSLVKPITKKSKTVKEEIKDLNSDLAKEIKNLDLNAEITALNVKYLNGQINNASLYLTASNEGKILLMPLIFEIPGEGTLRMMGVIDNDEIYPKFIGKIDGKGKAFGDSLKWLKFNSQNLKFDRLKNYIFFSNILLLPNSIYLNNLYLNLNDNDSEILGKLKIDHFSKNSHSQGSFRISKLVVDEFFFTAAQNIYLSPGSLLKKFLWLNNVQSHGEFDLSFDNLYYKNQYFKDQNTKFKFRPGFLDISNASFYSKDSDLETSFKIDISGGLPQLDLKIIGSRLNYQTPQVNFVDKAGEVTTSISRNFFDQIYALPSISDFYGKIDINIDDLKIDNLALGKFKLDGKIKAGNINKANARLQVYGGDLSYSGFLGIKLRKTINGNLRLTNASLNPLLNDIFEIKNIHGIANIAASITSFASSKKEFLPSLTSNVKFSSNSPYVEGFGLNDLVRKMFYPRRYRLDLREPESILHNPEAATVFAEAGGNFDIKAGKNSKLKIKIKAPAINAILSGKLNPNQNELDLLFNAIFISGTSKKTVPINIATSIKGGLTNYQSSTNLDQVKQYLGLSKPKKKSSALLPSQDSNSQKELDKTRLIKSPSANQNQMFAIPITKN